MIPLNTYVLQPGLLTLPWFSSFAHFGSWWQIPYYWVGIKAYDFIAGRENVTSSYVLSKRKALEAFPVLKEDNLKGAIVYYDGQVQIPSLPRCGTQRGSEVLAGNKANFLILDKWC